MLVVFDAVRRLEYYRVAKSELVIISCLRRVYEGCGVIKAVLIT
jgi:hypothetical protein